MSKHTCLINFSLNQFLITAACTNIAGKMKGSRTRAADWCPFVPRYSKDRLPLSWLFRWYYTENLELSICLFFRHWWHRVTVTTTPVPLETTLHLKDLNGYAYKLYASHHIEIGVFKNTVFLRKIISQMRYIALTRQSWRYLYHNRDATWASRHIKSWAPSLFNNWSG